MILSLLRFWTGPLPKEELFPHRKINPLLHWFVHPVKRRIAKYYLYILQKFFGLKVIAITGSSGKTTTANILFSVLSLHRPTVKTRDSVTSTYNLPTTILSCTPATRYLILEMGVEYPGDMDFYTWLAKPDIAILLNVSSVHSSFLGSVSDIYAEKAKLLSALPSNGFALINADDPEITFSRRSRVLKFGAAAGCFSRILSSSLTPGLETKIRLRVSGRTSTFILPLIGRHLASNLAAAAAVFDLLSVPDTAVSSGLRKLAPAPHRGNLILLKSGSLLIDDTYNANPASVSASLESLSQISKLKSLSPIFIFAQMNELGSYEKPAHEHIGRLVKKLRIKQFYCLGPATVYSIRTAGLGKYYDTFADLEKAVSPLINHKSAHPAGKAQIILIKGSNSWHLDKLLAK